MIELDNIDRKILYELDYDSRQPVSDLSRKLKLGRDRIAYRIRKLQDEEVLRKFTTTVNPYKFGLIVYKTYLRLVSNKGRVEAFVDSLRKHPRVYWVAECDGRWDLMFATFAKSPKDFHSIQDDILASFSDIISTFSVYTLVDVWFFRKNYLLGAGSDHFFFGGSPENYALDDIDFNLLRLLSENSRMSVRELSDQMGSTPMIVNYRIKKLESLGIIVGYRIEVDLAKIGMAFFKAQLDIHNHERHSEEQLLEYAKTNPHITLFIKQIGDCKVELELEAKDYDQYSRIIDDIRQRFSTLIRNIDTIVIRRESYKWMAFDQVRTDFLERDLASK